MPEILFCAIIYYEFPFNCRTEKKKYVSFKFILCIVYGYLHFDFESKKLNTRQIGVHEHLAMLLSLGFNIWARGMRTIAIKSLYQQHSISVSLLGHRSEKCI